ncbi:toxin glutamine deamidase domain-containing protein [Streptomyces kronopolitis]|uniref:toxin glutamine deamidase domain-containing protein n=1 Tax=Streptomyces kronopolitis TaxID=1612435 RepID=UPI0016686DD8|nr:toxin glutamine deamidase domain-containing protein [Streptomyces kronopolitis]
MVTLSVFFTGGMGAAAAAEPRKPESGIERCLSLPLKERLSCLKESLHDKKVVAGLSLIVFFIAEHEWHAEAKNRFPDLYKKSQDLKKLAQEVNSFKVKAEDFKDAKTGAEAVAIQKKLIEGLEKEFDLFYRPAVASAQLVKAMAELAVLLTPVLGMASEILDDKELWATVGNINSGLSVMDKALTGLNTDVAQMNRGLDEMHQGLNKMDQGLGQMNHALDGMNQAIDEANRAMERTNRAVSGMDKALDDLNKRLKSGAFSEEGSPFKGLDLSDAGDWIFGTSKAEQDKAKQAIISAIMNLLPGVGDAKGIAELLTGADSVTGEKLSSADRALGAVIFLRWVKAGRALIRAEDLSRAVKNEKALNRIGNIRWGEGGGGKTVLGDYYKTPVTEDLRKIVNPGKGGTNCRACVLGVEKTLDGAPASALPELGRGNLQTLEKYFPGKRFRDRSLSNLVKDIKSAGDGSRGIVFGADSRGGHVFNVINRDGDVVFLDGQSGHADPTGYTGYKFMRTK